jgi:hypothetical protein
MSKNRFQRKKYDLNFNEKLENKSIKLKIDTLNSWPISNSRKNRQFLQN